MGTAMEQAWRAGAPPGVEALQEMLGNLEAQLATLYEEKEHGSGGFGAASEAIAGMYEEKLRIGAQQVAAMQATIDGLDAQLRALYDEKAGGGFEGSALEATVASLTEQLHGFYEERELAAGVPTASSDLALRATVQGLEEQLHALYAEREQAGRSPGEATAMIDSLTDQVAALLEERNELVAQLDAARREVDGAKTKARRLIGAMLDETLG